MRIEQKILEFDFLWGGEANPNKELTIQSSTPLNVALLPYVNFTSDNEQPVVNPISAEIPERMEALYRLTGKGTTANNVCPHFFTSDKHIEPLWSKPAKYMEILSRYPLCISPDFSIYADMAKPQKRWNSFRNKLLTALWQAVGIRVIPAPSWGDLSDFDYYMEGWPTHSMIAVNSTGVAKDKRSSYIWREGYSRMLDMLQPIHILRYGSVIEGENVGISTFYTNNNRKEGNAYGC